MRKTITAAVVGGLLLSGCSSGTPAASTSTAPPTTTSTSTTTTTTSSAPTFDPESVSVCRSMVNELDRSTLGTLINEARAKGTMTPIAFATPVKDYRAVSAGAAEPAVGTAVNNFNRAIASLAASSFTQWTQDQVSALLTTNTLLANECAAVNSPLPR